LAIKITSESKQKFIINEPSKWLPTVWMYLIEKESPKWQSGEVCLRLSEPVE
jgi:hypothetical protein